MKIWKHLLVFPKNTGAGRLLFCVLTQSGEGLQLGPTQKRAIHWTRTSLQFVFLLHYRRHQILGQLARDRAESLPFAVSSTLYRLNQWREVVVVPHGFSALPSWLNDGGLSKMTASFDACLRRRGARWSGDFKASREVIYSLSLSLSRLCSCTLLCPLSYIIPSIIPSSRANTPLLYLIQQL